MAWLCLAWPCFALLCVVLLGFSHVCIMYALVLVRLSLCFRNLRSTDDKNASERMLEFNPENGHFRKFNNTAMPANSRQPLSDLHAATSSYRACLAWLCFAWLGLAWLCLAWQTSKRNQKAMQSRETERCTQHCVSCMHNECTATADAFFHVQTTSAKKSKIRMR